MKRLAATIAATILAAALTTGPASADPDPYHPYDTGDLSTVESCTWNYYRVVSIGEGLAHQYADAINRAEVAEAANTRLVTRATATTQRATRQAARIDRLTRRVAVLRAKLRGAR